MSSPITTKAEDYYQQILQLLSINSFNLQNSEMINHIFDEVNVIRKETRKLNEEVTDEAAFCNLLSLLQFQSEKIMNEVNRYCDEHGELLVNGNELKRLFFLLNDMFGISHSLLSTVKYN